MQHRDIILVVDDSPETLGFLTDLLDHAGYTVLIATDATSALSLVDRITPDVVLMDAVMPGMDGFEACRRIKNYKLLRHLPVIFMTGLDHTERVVEGLDAGGVDYIVKPIVVDVLLARIRVHLDNARAAKASRVALDATGRYLLATNGAGQLSWCTPMARNLLLAARAPGQGERDHALPPDLVDCLLRLRSDRSRMSARPPTAGGRAPLDFTYLGPTGPEEFLYCVTEAGEAGACETLQRKLRLTQREAEVLLWISRGKSNRDIGEILNISPRTINKHLERVFVKLGVENRASAAVQAERALATARPGAYAG